MKHIVFNLTNFDSNNIDGVGYYVKRILKVIDLHDKINKYTLLLPDGFNFEVLNIPNNHFNPVFLRIPKLQILRVLYKFLLLPIIVNRMNVDVLYSPAPPVSFFYAKSIKVVTTIHDLTPLIIDRGQGLLFKIYYYFIVKIALIKSHHVTTVSCNSFRDLNDFFKKNSTPITVIYNFIPEKKISPTESSDYFIFISTIQPGKNLERIIIAFEIFLRKSKSDFKLYIIGKDGWGCGEIKQLPAKYGISDKVIFTGYLSDFELEHHFRNCNSLIYASLYEGFGLPPLEVMYYGKPSVVSSTSSLPEVIGDAGIIVDPLDVESIAEGMIKVITPEIRNNLISSIPDQVIKFDPIAQVDKLLEIFEQD